VACWRVSADQHSNPPLVHSLKKPTREVQEVTVSNGAYVVARVGTGRYLALVTDVFEDEGEVDITLLMPRLPSKEFKWPKETKSATVPKPHILCKLILEEKNNKFYLTIEDKDRLIAIKIIKK